MTWRRPAHPDWVELFNAMGANVGTADALVDLSEESLLDTAVEATGSSPIPRAQRSSASATTS